MYSNRLAVMDQFSNTTDKLSTISREGIEQDFSLLAKRALFLQHLVEFDYVGEEDLHRAGIPHCSMSPKARHPTQYSGPA